MTVKDWIFKGKDFKNEFLDMHKSVIKMHDPNVVLTCKDQKQGGELILFSYSIKVIGVIIN